MKKLVPWRRYKTWDCILCGNCCYKTVKLQKNEVDEFNPKFIQVIDSTAAEHRYKEYFIKKDALDKCPFLDNKKCSIHSKKPYECKIFPFNITRIPLSKSDGSHFELNDKIYYVYVSSECSGFGHGVGIEKTIEKFIELWKKTEKKESLVMKRT